MIEKNPEDYKEKIISKIDELYNEYLKKKLDMIFHGSTGKIVNNPSIKKSNRLFNKKFLNETSKYKIVKKGGKTHIVDEQGTIICTTRHKVDTLFNEGYATVTNGKNEYNFLDSSGDLLCEKWHYSYFSPGFHNGCAQLSRYATQIDGFHKDYDVMVSVYNHNFIDLDGRITNEKWHSYELEFKYGRAIIYKDGKYNYIDEYGNLISDMWFDHVEEFEIDYAIVKNDNKYNVIDRNGNLLCKKWIEYEIARYYDGYPIVTTKYNDYRHIDYALFDINGERITTDEYHDIGKFKNGYAKVTKNNKYNFIDESGKLVSDTWYDYVFSFEDGKALVNTDNKYNYIDTKGKIINKNWFDLDSNGSILIEEVHSSYLLLTNNGKKSFLNSKGEAINEVWYDAAWSFIDGYARVKLNNKYNFINIEGKYVKDTWYDEAWNFCEGYARVKQDNKYNFIDKSGKLISETWYDHAYDFNDGYAKIITKEGYNFINSKGELINNLYHNSLFYFNSNLEDYNITSKLTGYICENKTTSFKLKYKPYYVLNSFYVLCYKNNECYLYNRLDNSYTSLGKCINICAINNILFDYKEQKVYLINDSKIIDITDYYNNNLLEKDNINIRDVKVDILTRDEFSILNMDKIDQIMSELKEETRKDEIKQSKEEEQKKLKEIKDENERKRKEQEQQKSEKLDLILSKFKELQKNIEELESVTEEKVKIPKINVNNLLIEVNDHLEINPILVDWLKYINLGYMSFDNVKLSGINFEDCNINFNPQKVYNKDLSNSNFNKVFISPFMDFTGVDIRGCTFSKDEDATTLDMFNMHFKDAIYDETTTYNGIPFTEILSKEQKNSNLKM